MIQHNNNYNRKINVPFSLVNTFDHTANCTFGERRRTAGRQLGTAGHPAYKYKSAKKVAAKIAEEIEKRFEK